MAGGMAATAGLACCRLAFANARGLHCTIQTWQRGKIAAPSLRQLQPTKPQRGGVVAAAKTAERPSRRRAQFVSVEPDASDAWRLEPVVEALREGAVGIIPTGACWCDKQV